jgi:16S rRNA (cytidine1402-2'-O)-methyltransferase
LNIQESFRNNDEQDGCLYLVATPIGNLEDMTFRAISCLKEADLIAAEDTRQTLKLCRHFDIQTPLTSYHEHNKKQSGSKLFEAMKNGQKVALVTDAGTPAISDPGYDLAVLCIEENIRVIPLPGANAAVTALIASGLPAARFTFYGFLPRGKKDKEQVLESISRFPMTTIFYESPFRVKDTLQAIEHVMGNRQVALAREITKKFETFIRGTVDEVSKYLAANEIKGECCILVEGSSEAASQEEMAWWDALTVEEHIDHYIKVKGLNSKDAIKKTAKERGLPKRDVYQLYHVDGE